MFYQVFTVLKWKPLCMYVCVCVYMYTHIYICKALCECIILAVLNLSSLFPPLHQNLILKIIGTESVKYSQLFEYL